MSNNISDLAIMPCNRLSDVEIVSLAAFFATLRETEINQHFHPHLLSSEEATKRATYSGKDLYYVILSGVKVVSYGMLRGWDEGYSIPSLGIAIRAEHRGSGLGHLFMDFLHHAARQKGASKVMLKVYPSNSVAIRLYKKMGYQFPAENQGQLVGYLTL